MGEKKFPGPIKPFCEELFFKKKICESVSIPVSITEPLMVGLSVGTEPRDVTRQAFRDFIAEYLGKSRKEVDDMGSPTILNRLCGFSHKKGEVVVIVHKKGELQDYLTSHDIKVQPHEISEQKKLSQTIEEQVPSDGTRKGPEPSGDSTSKSSVEWKRARKKPVEVEFREVRGIEEVFDTDTKPWTWKKGETIHTLEGDMVAIEGKHFIIKSVKSEVYPILKEIFNATYDVLE